jgi:hypothetical protein
MRTELKQRTILTLSLCAALAGTLTNGLADTASPAASPSKPAATAGSPSLETLFPAGKAAPLFDGATLRGWKITDFAGHADVDVAKDFKGGPVIVIREGASLSGIQWTNPVPNLDYEVALEAMKLQGGDFFCGLTVPVKDSFCTLILGGWGGSLIGISSVDGNDASLNETTKYQKFDDNRWYRIRMKVTKNKIEAWLDAEQIVDLDTTGKKISLRFGEIEESKPLGIATYQTRAAMRNITIKRLAPAKP